MRDALHRWRAPTESLDADVVPFVAHGFHNHFCYRGVKSYPEEPGFLGRTLQAAEGAYLDRYTHFVPHLVLQEQPEEQDEEQPESGPQSTEGWSCPANS